MNAALLGCAHNDVVGLVLLLFWHGRGVALVSRTYARDVERTLARMLERRGAGARSAEALIVRDEDLAGAVERLQALGPAVLRTHPRPIARVDLTALLPTQAVQVETGGAS